ncbi:hypothetical protein E2562_020265 [Oryza meyeriana var. granulata]|uniref:Uncharacterized protein n=1 Tax=Oryza meyeriana var. granulata TaxID=110450 RepID=A0A6G1DLP9_9ORYZ|nr:hypothetical protein E2562_020265 [Oryza meyeriana var. granulata]
MSSKARAPDTTDGDTVEEAAATAILDLDMVSSQDKERSAEKQLATRPSGLEQPKNPPSETSSRGWRSKGMAAWACTACSRGWRACSRGWHALMEGELVCLRRNHLYLRATDRELAVVTNRRDRELGTREC